MGEGKDGRGWVYQVASRGVGWHFEGGFRISHQDSYDVRVKASMRDWLHHSI